ncbi:hypothetical protein EA004_13990 [Vibrio anguillarum]|uniref:Uncharacterized protein n=1 Tax=Vibrio anguillarum TaxID=55601 RepID=A0ABR9Z132_VIBAN|nr:hypothetical protein [Vibrio anguillarum]MBF4246138.1 hypothetical protein [Vibrio anguillarum]MBF4372163.1 hypothetical protein [Vibrio anguillarum]
MFFFKLLEQTPVGNITQILSSVVDDWRIQFAERYFLFRDNLTLRYLPIVVGRAIGALDQGRVKKLVAFRAEIFNAKKAGRGGNFAPELNGNFRGNGCQIDNS